MVEPAHVGLPSFSSATVKITAYSDMWGEYVDQLTCNVSF